MRLLLNGPAASDTAGDGRGAGGGGAHYPGGPTRDGLALVCPGNAQNLPGSASPFAVRGAGIASLKYRIVHNTHTPELVGRGGWGLVI